MEAVWPGPWQSEFWKAVLETFFSSSLPPLKSLVLSAVILIATIAAPGAATQSSP